jgi:hypothetical protein
MSELICSPVGKIQSQEKRRTEVEKRSRAAMALPENPANAAREASYPLAALVVTSHLALPCQAATTADVDPKD